MSPIFYSPYAFGLATTRQLYLNYLHPNMNSNLLTLKYCEPQGTLPQNFKILFRLGDETASHVGVTLDLAHMGLTYMEWSRCCLISLTWEREGEVKIDDIKSLLSNPVHPPIKEVIQDRRLDFVVIESSVGDFERALLRVLFDKTKVTPVKGNSMTADFILGSIRRPIMALLGHHNPNIAASGPTNERVPSPHLSHSEHSSRHSDDHEDRYQHRDRRRNSYDREDNREDYRGRGYDHHHHHHHQPWGRGRGRGGWEEDREWRGRGRWHRGRGRGWRGS